MSDNRNSGYQPTPAREQVRGIGQQFEESQKATHFRVCIGSRCAEAVHVYRSGRYYPELGQRLRYKHESGTVGSKSPECPHRRPMTCIAGVGYPKQDARIDPDRTQGNSSG